MQLSAAFSAIGGKAVIATLVVFGLLLIPVECSVAMGPHTLFVSADAIADLQGDGATKATQHLDSHADAASEHHAPASDLPQPDPNAALAHGEREPAPHDATDASGAHLSSTPPRPAGISADAVVTLALPGDHPLPMGPSDNEPAPRVLSPPPDRLLTGPEPPPP